MEYVGSKGNRVMMAYIFKDVILTGDESYLFEDPVGISINQYIQAYTGHSYDTLKESILSAYKIRTTKLDCDLDSLRKEAENMTIKELAVKYNKPEQSVRNYLNRHGIKYLKVSSNETRQIRWNNISEELISLNGAYTIDELVHMKNYSFSGCNYNTIKKFCDENNIPYRTRVC